MTIRQNYLVITAHDYRTRRKANMHFIAEELAKRGKTRFFSMRFSELTRFRPDPRHDLYSKANHVETVDDIDCYLWKTPIHAFNTRIPALKGVESLLFNAYEAAAPEIFKQWIKEATTVIFESGYAILFYALVKKLNPTAATIYIASDAMGTINSASRPCEILNRVATELTGIRVPSPRLAEEFPEASRVFFVPQGIDPSIKNHADPSPYTAPFNAVSVGSMLFDRELIKTAATLYSDVQFHVIGSGSDWTKDKPKNVVVYDEMPHRDTLRYIKHATFGIAPYKGDDVPYYLADTSMKLMQYEFFGLPVICPNRVVGTNPFRIGYDASHVWSINVAISKALAAPHATGRQFLTWSEVTDRILDPGNFPDTKIADRIQARVA